MQKIFRFFLASNRKRRIRAVSAAISLLRLLHDLEDDEMRSSEDMLDSFDSGDEGFRPSRNYNDIEEAYFSCENAVCFLESAIDELECVY